VQMPRSLAGVPITPVGKLMHGSTVSQVHADGRRTPLVAGGWEHFARSR
jgi:hypothetical protein